MTNSYSNLHGINHFKGLKTPAQKNFLVKKWSGSHY